MRSRRVQTTFGIGFSWAPYAEKAGYLTEEHSFRDFS